MDLGILMLIFGSDRQFRRVKAIKNTLRGRRTVSNLYWALEYGMLDFIDVLHGADFGEDQPVLAQLSANGLAQADDDFRIQLTAKGVEQQQAYLNQLLPLESLAVSSRYDVAKFMRRFSFTTQIVSEFSYGNNQYYPQSINYFEDQLLKRWFIDHKQDHLPEHFRQLLNSFFSDLHQDELADLFVQSLVGHDFSGLTAEQVAVKRHVPTTIIELQWLQLYGMLLEKVMRAGKTSLFAPLTAGLAKPIISNSAQTTFKMFVRQADRNPHAIATQRHIKLTTVYEHLLEAAILTPVAKFPYRTLISEDLMNQLVAHQPANVGEWSFQDASQVVNQLAFFQFRLFQIYRSKTTDGH